jgi:hypothetical protein
MAKLAALKSRRSNAESRLPAPGPWTPDLGSRISQLSRLLCPVPTRASGARLRLFRWRHPPALPRLRAISEIQLNPLICKHYSAVAMDLKYEDGEPGSGILVPRIARF